MESILWFGAYIAALCVVIVIRTPLAVGMGLIGAAATAYLVSPKAVIQVGSIAFAESTSFVLVVAPLFILMGEVIARSGMGSSLFQAAAIATRRLPGSLGVATIAACTGFSAVCGSSAVTAVTIGSIAVPEMVKHGYSKQLALGAAAAGGTLGILIPPSVPMILYGVITNTSIGDLFLAGIIPGLMMATLFAITVMISVRRSPPVKVTQPHAATTVRKSDARELLEATPVVLVAVIIAVGLYGGWATPTELGAVGAAAAILVAFLLGRLRIKMMSEILGNTAQTTATFMFLLIGGLFNAFVLARLGVPQGVSEGLLSLELPGWAIIVALNVLLVILGMFLDPLSVLVIVVPIFLHTVVTLGYDPVWFGVIVTIQSEIAAITPPVGFNLFMLKMSVPGTLMSDVVRGSMQFLPAMLIGLVLILVFPEIALFLPNLAK